MKETNSEIAKCDVCGLRPHVSVWGTGIKRCEPCDADQRALVQDKRRREFEAERARLKAHCDAREAAGSCPDDGEVCSECCEHEFDPSEGMMCLNCNKEWDGP